MAYHIFLKSLRSPEEFMKNPHIKIPPKSPPTNFQSLCIFKKIQNLFGNNSPQISAHPAQPRLCWPASPAALAYLPKGASSLSLHSPATMLRLSHVSAKWAPTVRSTPFFASADPNPITTSPRRI
jgi:hypothetical protein